MMVLAVKMTNKNKLKIFVMVLCFLIFSSIALAAPYVDDGVFLLGWAYNITGNDNNTVTLTYDYVSLINQINDENNLYLFYFDYSQMQWLFLDDGIRNTSANIITIEQPGNIFPRLYVLGEVSDTDDDGVNDYEDLCPNTTLPDSVPTQTLKPNHYGRNFILLGCSASQILYCKPGNNNGEYKFGITQGTVDVWSNQNGWAQDCLDTNGKAILEGQQKPANIDTDNDGIPDSEDSMTEDADNSGNNYGVPDWYS